MKKLVTHLFAAAVAVACAAPSAKADTPFVGEVRQFGFNFCPRGWAPLDGRLIAIAQNDALFSLLGTRYGGDGRTTFGLPDMRGRIAVKDGTGPGLTTQSLGAKYGVEDNNISIANMPSHTHDPLGTLGAQLLASSEEPATNDPSGAYFPTSTQPFYAGTEGTKKDMAPGSVTVDTSGEIIGQNGSNMSVTNMAPSLVNNWCMALFGIYPSRS